VSEGISIVRLQNFGAKISSDSSYHSLAAVDIWGRAKLTLNFRFDEDGEFPYKQSDYRQSEVPGLPMRVRGRLVDP
jgi:hypothetical protein